MVSPKTNRVTKVRIFEDAETIDGGGWTHVRHVPAGFNWHPATDQLQGTDVYGNKYEPNEPWSE